VLLLVFKYSVLGNLGFVFNLGSLAENGSSERERVMREQIKTAPENVRSVELLMSHNSFLECLSELHLGTTEIRTACIRKNCLYLSFEPVHFHLQIRRLEQPYA